MTPDSGASILLFVAIALVALFHIRRRRPIPISSRAQARADAIRPDHPHFSPRRFVGTKADGQCWYCSLPAPAETFALRVKLGLEGGIDAEGGRL